MPSYDAIIVGGGSNGLAAAGRLAKAGRKVLVLEARPRAGGGSETREFAKGYRVSGVAHLVNMLDPRVVKDLKLERHGLKFVTALLPTTALSASGDHLVLEGAYGEILKGSISGSDQAAWRALRHRLMGFAAILRPFKQMTPPRLAEKAGNDRLKLLQLGLRLRALGANEMREFLRLLLINVADVLNDELSDERLKGVIAHDTVLGAYLGPRSPNSLLLLLNRLAGEVSGKPAALALPAGGMGAVADCLVKAVEALGVTVRTATTVKSITIENDAAMAVVTDKGETLTARHIVSALNPKTTLLELVDRRHFDIGFVRRLQAIRMRGTTAKLHLALKGTPDFKGADLRSRLVIAPSVGAVENAFNAVKYGEFSPEPVMELVLPTAFEKGHAPEGHHVLSAVVHYAPYDLKGGWVKGKKDFLKAILKQLEAHAPGIGRLVVAGELLTPQDLESQYGFIGGNWHHGELAVEQMLFLRPMPGLAQYETPIAGLYLAGAGCHPGGGVSGAAGWNAAERILQMEGRR